MAPIRSAHLPPLLCCLLSLLLLRPAGAGDVFSGPVLDKTLRLDLWGVTLVEAAKAMSQQTRVDIVLHGPDFPSGSDDGRNVYLVTGQVTLRTALECLGRRFGFRYRLVDSGRVELSRSYDWVESDQFGVRFFHDLDTLVPVEGGNPERIRTILGEYVKVLPLLNGDFSLTVAHSPMPGRLTAVRGEAVLPPALADYLEKAIQCLAGATGDYPPPPRLRPTLSRLAHDSRLDWENLLASHYAVPRDADPRTCLKQICGQAGIAVILGNPPTPHPATQLSEVTVNQASLRVILAGLSSRLGMRRRVLLDSGAVVFETSIRDEWANDGRRRELLWSGLGVAGFDIHAAATAMGGGEKLAAMLRREVFPEIWRDPATAISYEAATGRLVVIAPQNVLTAVAEKLRTLSTHPTLRSSE